MFISVNFSAASWSKKCKETANEYEQKKHKLWYLIHTWTDKAFNESKNKKTNTIKHKIWLEPKDRGKGENWKHDGGRIARFSAPR